MLPSSIQKCSFVFLLLVAVALTAPTTRDLAGSETLHNLRRARAAPASTIATPTSPAAAATQEAGLASSPLITTPAEHFNQVLTTEMPGMASMATTTVSTTGSPAEKAAEPGTEIKLDVTAVTTESTYCSATNQSHAFASYKKGLALVYNLMDRHMRDLIATPFHCRNKAILNALNVTIHAINNNGTVAQALAYSIGKINSYVDLIKTTLVGSVQDEDMTALIDVLQGVVQDLDILRSPGYCDCIKSNSETDCFPIPTLRTEYSEEDCNNAVSYIAATLEHELLLIQILIGSWVELGPLPEISHGNWLSSHVDNNSPAFKKLI